MTATAADDRRYLIERVDDVAVVQLYADGFARLSPRERVLCFHLAQAAIAGRPIYIAQRCADGPAIRDLVEEILTHADEVDPKTLDEVRRYAKLFWINNSPYNYVTARKNVIACPQDALATAAEAAARRGARLPLRKGEAPADLVRRLAPVMCDPRHAPMVTAKNPERGEDIIEASAVNFYGDGVRLADFDGFSESFGLNSNVVKRGGKLVEIPWRAGDPTLGIAPGIYAEQLQEVNRRLSAAIPFAPPATRNALEALIRFNRTGLAEDFRRYCIAWVADKDSPVDTVNGFIEAYMDPRGKKGAFEAIVAYEDPRKADLIKKIADAAQWFEDHMPYAPEFRKPNVRGISAKSIDVVIETGDAGPVTPIGVNLPNPQDIREEYGSKSVSLANVVDAYEKSTPPAARREFCWDEEEAARAEKWTALTGDLHTNMHEVIGHASGRQAPGRAGDSATWIREYDSALEEARADLVALWFIMDPKMKELGLTDDPEAAARAEYEQYTRNGGLQQLRRVRHGDQLEEDHMRNRQMIVRWILDNSRAIEVRRRDGKTFLSVTDPKAWREAAGRLLAEVQRIKSTGDYAAAKALFESYGVKFDPALRDEVVARYERLNVPSYTAFVMPRITPIRDARGEIVDAEISYPLSLEDQMLEWSGRR